MKVVGYVCVEGYTSSVRSLYINIQMHVFYFKQAKWGQLYDFSDTIHDRLFLRLAKCKLISRLPCHIVA